jgi:hypothetical protein
MFFFIILVEGWRYAILNRREDMHKAFETGVGAAA